MFGLTHAHACWSCMFVTHACACMCPLPPGPGESTHTIAVTLARSLARRYQCPPTVAHTIWCARLWYSISTVIYYTFESGAIWSIDIPPGSRVWGAWPTRWNIQYHVRPLAAVIRYRYRVMAVSSEQVCFALLASLTQHNASSALCCVRSSRSRPP